jgi:hypothetical protein
MFQCVEAFQRKLSLFSAHMTISNFTHFPMLSKMTAEVDPSTILCKVQEFVNNIDELAKEFENEFVNVAKKASVSVYH